MDHHTLTLYTVAGAISLSLSALLAAFARLQGGTRATRATALAILVLAVGFIGAGIGPLLPRWATVIGTNMMLIAAGPILHAGFSAFCAQRRPVLDRVGWGVVAFTALPFWYWGLVEPNGDYRSAVFSFAIVAISSRTALLFLRAARRPDGSRPMAMLAVVFGVLVAWMTLRGGGYLLANTPPAVLRGANPTAWPSVLGYIVLIAFMAASVLWLEQDHLRHNPADVEVERGPGLTLATTPRSKLLLLWGTVGVLFLCLVGALGVTYSTMYESERTRLTTQSGFANDAFVEHTLQMINQVDILLRAARGYYLRTGSVAETERYVASLGFNRELIDNVYLLNAEGQILVPWAERGKQRSGAHRDYFAFHRQTTEDVLFIGPVQTGQVTGKKQFRLTRRIDHPDGSFAGVVVAPVEPRAFSNYYRQLVAGHDGIATLLGTVDHRIRARAPEPDAAGWNMQLESVVWRLLADAPQGSYLTRSTIDGIERQLHYKRVGELPLIMVTGFSAADLRASTLARMQWLAGIMIVFTLFILLFAVLLTLEIRRRDEQERFMAMLNHELKTPLSVIRMTLGGGGLPVEIRDRAGRAVRDMGAIVERCLQADRLASGRVTPSFAACHADDLLAQAVAASAAPERVDMQMATLPAIRTDAQLLGVIVNNLLDNALKYGATEGRVTVAAAVATPGGGHGRDGIRITVANPPGSAGRPDPDRVFSKYYRAPGAHGKTGSGLGLHIAAALARKLGGMLAYRPAGEAIKFELWLPL